MKHERIQSSLLLQELGDSLQWRESGPTINDRSGDYVRGQVRDYLGDRWKDVKWLQSDENYRLVIKPHLKEFLEADRTADLSTDGNRDCDDYALRLAANAQRAGFDLGQVYDSSANHAYCLAVFPGPAKPVLIEPQTRELVDIGDKTFVEYSLKRGTVYY